MSIHNRGFSSMAPDKQRKIASKGGKAAHAKGTAQEWNVEEARKAGKLGGIAFHKNNRKYQKVVEKQDD